MPLAFCRPHYALLSSFNIFHFQYSVAWPGDPRRSLAGLVWKALIYFSAGVSTMLR